VCGSEPTELAIARSFHSGSRGRRATRMNAPWPSAVGLWAINRHRLRHRSTRWLRNANATWSC